MSSGKKKIPPKPEKMFKSSVKDKKLFKNDSIADRVKLEEWTLPNDKGFVRFLKSFDIETRAQIREPTKLWNTKEKKYNDISGYSHQKFVSDFMSDNSPYRGMLLYHGLGSGKSGASIMITEGFRNRRVVVMLPASLRNNYERELATFADIAYKKEYHWVFIDLSKIPLDKMDYIKEQLKIKGVQPEVFDKIMVNLDKKYTKGIWMISYDKEEPNFDKLSESQQIHITEQIKIMHEHRFTILNYNSGQYTITNIFEKLSPEYVNINLALFPGKKKSELSNKDRTDLLNYMYDPENKVPNPFDNKVLVIDEIHNLTASMVGSGFNGPKIYELIMRAKNLKLVLLSGTPVINYAFELGLMMNMLRGLIRSFKIKISSLNGKFNKEQLTKILRGISQIDRFKIDIRKQTIDVTRVPIGFEKNSKNNNVIKSEVNNDTSDIHFVDLILERLLKSGYAKDGEHVTNYYSMFPGLLTNKYTTGSMLGHSADKDVSKDTFNSFYIEQETFSLKNTITFQNRIIGLVSFYNEISGKDEATGADIFPELEFADEEDTTAMMSNFQFIEYAAKREIERQLEDLNKRRGGLNQKVMIESVTENVPNLFRVFSRQKGLFVFPPTIERPMPPKKDEFLKETITTSVSKEVVDSIDKKLKEIFSQPGDTQQASLEEYFPELSKDEESIASQLIKKIHLDDATHYTNTSEWLKTFAFNDSDPDNIDQDVTSEKTEETYRDICLKAIGLLTKENLSITGEGINLMDLSPKYAKMLTNINNTPGLVFGYSQFRSVEGIEIFAKILKEHGYSQVVSSVVGKKATLEIDETIIVGAMVRYESADNYWRTYKVVDVDSDDVTLDGIDDVVHISKLHRACFALWTGTESVEERSAILDLYRGLNNKFGQKCLMLFTTQSGAEGISLNFVRQVHVMEPYWNNVRVEQVIGRARRIKSHVLLPEDQRNVKVFKYIIKLTDGQKNGTWIEDMTEGEFDLLLESKDTGFDKDEYSDESDASKLTKAFKVYASELSKKISINDDGLTSDEVLAAISINKKRILDGFLTLMKQTAVDCNFNKSDNILSNSEPESQKCYDIILGEGDVSYDIWSEPTESKSMGSFAEGAQLKEVKTKKLILTHNIKGSKIKTFTTLPAELAELSIKDAINLLPVGHKVYDYYIYNQLYYAENTAAFKSLYTAGEIKKNSDGQNIIRFTPGYISRVQQYSEIESCIVELRDEYPEPTSSTTDRQILSWAIRIKECHKKKKKIWFCSLCASGVEGERCSGCGLTEEEATSTAKEAGLYVDDEQQSMISSGSLDSSQSMTSKKSATSVYIDSSDEDTSDDDE